MPADNMCSRPARDCGGVGNGGHRRGGGAIRCRICGRGALPLPRTQAFRAVQSPSASAASQQARDTEHGSHGYGSTVSATHERRLVAGAIRPHRSRIAADKTGQRARERRACEAEPACGNARAAPRPPVPGSSPTCASYSPIERLPQLVARSIWTAITGYSASRMVSSWR